MNQTLNDKFNSIKEIMEDYYNICNYECNGCLFSLVVGYVFEGCELKFCDAIDKIFD